MASATVDSRAYTRATRSIVAAVISHTWTEKHLKISNESGICGQDDREREITNLPLLFN